MVYCSRKCQIFSSTVCALIWAAVFIVAMLVPMIIQQAQYAGVKKLIVMDKSVWTDKQWNDYSVSTLDMKYYIWNATNLHDVLSAADGSVPLKWAAVGPFNISKVSRLESYSGESGSSPTPYFTYRKLTTYEFVDQGTRDLLLRPIVGVNALWVGAIAAGARSLYQATIANQVATQFAPLIAQAKAQNDTAQIAQLTAQQNAIIIEQSRQQLFPTSLNKESIFYGAVSGALLGGAAPQFTGVTSTGSVAPSVLLPALRILSIGSYLAGAIKTFGYDANVTYIYPQASLIGKTTPQEIAAASGYIAFRWALGVGANSTSQRLAAAALPQTAAQLFIDFELNSVVTPQVANNTATLAFNQLDTSDASVALVTIQGLKNWGAVLTCAAASNQFADTSKCVPATLPLIGLLQQKYGPTEFQRILFWILPLIDAVPGITPLAPDWKRNYALVQFPVPGNVTTAPVLLYTANTARERFQQIIVTGFEGLVTQLATDPNLPTNAAINTAAYPFAQAAARVDGLPDPAAWQADQKKAINSFHDLAALQYGTGWVVGLALKNPNPTVNITEVQWAGLTVSSAAALGATAGFGSSLNLANEPIEFSSAVQLVDPTLDISRTRLSFEQSQLLLKFLQFGAPALGIPAALIPAALIGYGLVMENVILQVQKQLKSVTGPAAPFVAPFKELRTTAIFDGIRLNAPAQVTPQLYEDLTLNGTWYAVKAGILAQQPTAAAFLSPMDVMIAYVKINTVTQLRAFGAYFHTYFRRLQGGVGPITAQYANPAYPRSTAAIDKEGYQPAYGVSKRSNGLFIQRTAFEFLFGSRSHLSGTDTKSILNPQTTFLNEDLAELEKAGVADGAIPANTVPGTNPIYLTKQHMASTPNNKLEDALKRNAIVQIGQDTQIHTGRGDVDKVGRYHVYNGVIFYNSSCQYSNPGDSALTVGAADSRIPGEVLRPACVWGSAADYYVFNNNFQEVIGDTVNDPTQFQPFREGSNNILPTIGTFIPELQRDVYFNYAGEVTFKGINLRQYRIDSRYLNANDGAGAAANPFKNDNYRQTATPGFYPVAPDGIVSGLFPNAAPIYISKPHFLGTDAIIPNQYAGGSFNATSEEHDTFLNIDALSGKTLQARKRLQANILVTATTMDASPHLEPFFKSGGGGDKYIPFYWAEEAGTIKDDDADTFKKNIYKARDLGKIIQIVVGVISAVLFVACVALVVRSCTKHESTTDKSTA